MKQISGKILACTLLIALVGGCGFQLRGSSNDSTATSIEALTVTTGQKHGKLARALEAEMRAQHIADGGKTAWNLVVLDQDIKQNVLAYNDSDNAALFEIELVVQFTVTNEKGETVIAPNSERVVRPYEPDTNRALATDRETKLLLDETYKEMASDLLRRINFIANQKAGDTPPESNP